ncbi:MAG TPA: divergent PAP2 family protein [Anaerolineales bacterium]
MNLIGILHNDVLLSAFVAWITAQALKIPMEYLRSHHWQWAMALAAGGMPSSHSAVIVGATQAIGLHQGYDSPLFALGVVISMIVTYDAAGVRRQAGKHAERINILFDELMHGQMPDEKELREVLGHTPLEVLGGVLWGIVVATLVWLLGK